MNVDTGKMAWYYQTSPHDTHDWDSAQTPILIDGTINGQPRKLVSTASRNGYFFTLDRVTGEHVVTAKFGTTTNWAKGVRPNGAPDPDPGKEATIPGSLVSPVEGGVTNWPPPAYSPDTGLFYVHENNGFNIALSDRSRSARLDGPRRKTRGRRRRRRRAALTRDRLQDRQGRRGGTSSRAQRRRRRSAARDRRQAGVHRRRQRQLRRLRRDQRQAAVAHAHRQADSNAPQTYMLDGQQHVLAVDGDTLYSFAIY